MSELQKKIFATISAVTIHVSGIWYNLDLYLSELGCSAATPKEVYAGLDTGTIISSAEVQSTRPSEWLDDYSVQLVDSASFG